LRNDLETREIADAELDAVAGGISATGTVGTLAGAVVTDVTNVVNSLETTQAVLGVVGGVVGGVTGGASVTAGGVGSASVSL
jgi:hypothetical protein